MAATNTLEDAMAATEVTATTNASEDVASHDSDVLCSRCLQPVCQNESYSTQDWAVTGIYTGPLPRPASGRLRVIKSMVPNTQERKTQHKLRAQAATTILETEQDLEPLKAILIPNKTRDYEPDRRADLRPGLLEVGNFTVRCCTPSRPQ